jgi:hypothetical protein
MNILVIILLWVSGSIAGYWMFRKTVKYNCDHDLSWSNILIGFYHSIIGSWLTFIVSLMMYMFFYIDSRKTNIKPPKWLR